MDERLKNLGRKEDFRLEMIRKLKLAKEKAHKLPSNETKTPN